MQFSSSMFAGIVAIGLLSCASSVMLRATVETEADAPAENCGLLPTYQNARPRDFTDYRRTKYDTEKKETVENAFVAGDVAVYSCEKGYTVDGSPKGATEFDVECTENSFFKPKGMCLKTSKCGAASEIANAIPTGRAGTAPGSIEYACAVGYSTDGKKVVAGGFGANRLFEVRCQSFGQWERWEGECKPYSYLPAGKTNTMYAKAFEAIFKVNCKGSLTKSFYYEYALPKAFEVCAPFKTTSEKEDCQLALQDFNEYYEEERNKWEEENKHMSKDVDWHKTNFTEKTDIGDRASSFCEDMWNIITAK